MTLSAVQVVVQALQGHRAPEAIPFPMNRRKERLASYHPVRPPTDFSPQTPVNTKLLGRAYSVHSLRLTMRSGSYIRRRSGRQNLNNGWSTIAGKRCANRDNTHKSIVYPTHPHHYNLKSGYPARTWGLLQDIATFNPSLVSRPFLTFGARLCISHKNPQ